MNGPDDFPPKDYMTFREAIAMFVSKAEFDKFVTRVETKIDSVETKIDGVVRNQLPKWFVPVAIGLVGPIMGALVSYFLIHVLGRP